MARPSSRNAAERFVILKYCFVYALTAPPRDMLSDWIQKWSGDDRDKFVKDVEAKREDFWRGLKSLGLWEKLSPIELKLAQQTVVTMTDRQQVDATWRMEAAVVLLWALQAVDLLPPFDAQASHGL